MGDNENAGSGEYPCGLTFFQLCIFGCAFLVAMAGSAAAVYLFWRWRSGNSAGGKGGKSEADRATSGRKGDDLEDDGDTTATDDEQPGSKAEAGSIESVESVYE